MTGAFWTGLPHCVPVLVPSHVLAEESAAAWREAGAEVAVHRDFEAQHPAQKAPMRRYLDLVRMAIVSGQSVFANSCLRNGGSRCHAFNGCLKQENLQGIAHADVVIAPYDTQFSGLAVEADHVALLVIDERGWAQALRETQGMFARAWLVEAGLTPVDCVTVAVLEAQLRADPGLRPRRAAGRAQAGGGDGASGGTVDPL
jgi:hypothetical protein